MNKPTDSIVLLVVPSYAHDERISRQVHHYLSNKNPAKGSPLFGSIMLGQACYWLTGICFSERLHADSTASFISSSYVPKEPGKCVKTVRDSSAHTSLLQPQIWLSCPNNNNNFMHSKYNPPAIFQSASFPLQWSQMFFFSHWNFQAALLHDWHEKAVPVRPWSFLNDRQQQTIKNLMDAGLHVSCWKCTCFVWLCGCLLLIPECAKDCAHVSNSCSMRLMAGGIGWPSAADTWCVFVDNCLAGLNFKKSTCKIPQVTVLVFVVRHQVKV